MKEEFAVIETGGKQYRVSAGDVISIEKINGEHKVGDKINFGKVLLVERGSNTDIGLPYISGASVSGEILSIGLKKKIEVIKYKAKSRYYKNRGHRQPFFKVKISSIA